MEGTSLGQPEAFKAAAAGYGPNLDREAAGTWALVDRLVRRSALLALLPGVRSGRPDLARFAAYAQPMLAEGVLHPQGDRLGGAGDLAPRSVVGRPVDARQYVANVGGDLPGGGAAAPR